MEHPRAKRTFHDENKFTIIEYDIVCFSGEMKFTVVDTMKFVLEKKEYHGDDEENQPSRKKEIVRYKPY